MKKVKTSLLLFVVLVLALSTTAAFAHGKSFPEKFSLPDGFRPEGIVSGYGTDFYAGSLANGAIYKGDFRTGLGEVMISGVDGKIAVGLAFDERTGYLFVSGGPTGTASVYDTRTGEQVGHFQMAAPGTSFINDVVVSQSAAYFTDSSNARLFKLPFEPTGELPDSSAFEALSLSGDWEQVAGFNANGIDATPDGKMLVVVNSTVGSLYSIDAYNEMDSTLEAKFIDLGGASVSNGDGILLDGKTIYVVRNFLNQIDAFKLAPDLSSGKLVDSFTEEEYDFDIPTTVTEFGSRLYAVNARFSTPPAPNTEYQVVQVSKR